MVAVFDEFDADGSGTIDDAEWDGLVDVLLSRAPDLAPSSKQLDIKQCREMVRIQLELEEVDSDVPESFIDVLFSGKNTRNPHHIHRPP